MHRAARLSLLAALALLAGCGSSSPGSSAADASTDVRGDGATSGDSGGEELPPLPPPSNDCRYIDDGTTCADTYVLNSAELYECGHLTATDTNDAGAMAPYAPPLPYTYDCRNVASPMPDPAAPSLTMGASWCCLSDPQKCVRAIALDPTCPSSAGTGKAWSCPSMGLDYPPGSNDGGACVMVNEADAGLTPPQNTNEAIFCCP